MRQGGENSLQNICGLYVSVNDDGIIKRNLTVKSGETIKVGRTTVNDEIIAFSELNFKYYAELLEHIENMCEDSYVEITDGDFGEAGIDVDAYAEKLLEVIESPKSFSQNAVEYVKPYTDVCVLEELKELYKVG